MQTKPTEINKNKKDGVNAVANSTEATGKPKRTRQASDDTQAIRGRRLLREIRSRKARAKLDYEETIAAADRELADLNSSFSASVLEIIADLDAVEMARANRAQLAVDLPKAAE